MWGSPAGAGLGATVGGILGASLGSRAHEIRMNDAALAHIGLGPDEISGEGNPYLNKAASMLDAFKGLRPAIGSALGKGADMAAATTRANRIAAVTTGRTAQISAAKNLSNIPTGGVGHKEIANRMLAKPLLDSKIGKAEASLGKMTGLKASNGQALQSAELNMRRSQAQIAKAGAITAGAGLGAMALHKATSKDNSQYPQGYGPY
jgi:hypothetical protein